MPNFYRNGDLELGNTEGWAQRLPWQFADYVPGDAPPGTDLPGSARYQPVTTTALIDPMFRAPVNLRPGDVLFFETWIKADKPGSKVYWEAKDPDGQSLFYTQGGHRWEAIEGGAGASSYPISDWEVPTEWTLVKSRHMIEAAVTVDRGAFYVNHPKGTTFDARVSLAGTRLYVENPRPGIVDNWLTPAEAGLASDLWTITSSGASQPPVVDYSIQTPTGSNAFKIQGSGGQGNYRFTMNSALPLVANARYYLEYDILSAPQASTSPNSGLRIETRISQFEDKMWEFAGDDLSLDRWVHRRVPFVARGNGADVISSYITDTLTGPMWISGIKVSKAIEPMPIAEPLMDNRIDEGYLAEGPFEMSPFYGTQGFPSGSVTRGREAPGIYSFTIASGTVATTNNALMGSFHAKGGTDRPSSLYFPVTPGETIKVEYAAATAGRHPTPDGNFEAMVYFYTQNQWGAVTGASARTLTPDAQGRFSGTLDVPDDKNVATFYARALNYDGVEVMSPLKGLYSDLYVGAIDPKGAVTEVSIATAAREGITSDIFVRSREKIDVQLARPDEQLIAGERIELAAFAASASDMAWRWRQVTGPPVALIREENTATFIAPDVAEPTDLRIACRASSVDGANSSDWHFFDLTIDPPRTRWIPEEGAEFVPRSPQMVGYDRGKREIWNDVTEPVGMDSAGRWDAVLRDLGIPADDVQFVHDGAPPKRAAAGGVYIDIETGEIYRNFGGGYNETENTEGAPRLNAYMVNPATGDVYEWIEEES